MLASPHLSLTQKYAPRHLADVFGQTFLVRYLTAVAANPDAAHRNTIITGPFGCVHPDTLLDTPSGPVAISQFKGGPVLSWDGAQVVEATALSPVAYPPTEMLEVQTDSGHKIVCTSEHRFFTDSGWKKLSEFASLPSYGGVRLAASEHPQGRRDGPFLSGLPSSAPILAACEPSPQGSSLARAPSALQPGALRSRSTVRAGRGRCLSSRLCGGPLLRGEDTSPVFAPLPVDARGRTRCCSRRDAQGRALKHIRLCPGAGLLSRLGSWLHFSFQGLEAQYRFAGIGALPKSQSSPSVPRSHGQTVPLELETVFDPRCIEQSSQTFFTSIRSIKLVGTSVYYDMHVPGHNCYFAQGLLNHNCGKTSIVRAFANDLLGTECAWQTPNFIEIDSYKIRDRATMLDLKDYIFQELPGYKVVLLDEWHLVPPEVQAGLLKDIEECTAPIFFFFASTERNGILDTIYSRSLDFTVSKFSREQCFEYLGKVCEQENLQLAPETQEALVFRSYGHLRNLLNQLDLLTSMSEEAYVTLSNEVIYKTEQLFLAPSSAAVQALTSFPYTYVREAIEYFIYERLITRKEVFILADIPKIFTFYLKYKRHITDENDFFSFLMLFADLLKSSRRLDG